LNPRAVIPNFYIRMFLLTRPTAAYIAAFLEARKADSFSYTDVGVTRTSPPRGFAVDHNRIMLGHGEEVFDRAKKAVRQWKMFDIPGIELFYSDSPIETGRDVALLAKHLGIYSLNACRIVYVVDEPSRFGFAYGTLSEHAESGEERFTVELHPETDEVWYDVFAFSRPGHFLVKLGYPYGRYRQKQFAIGSKEAIRRACTI
jgi:uncharacterized protein (UPF0548 family)